MSRLHIMQIVLLISNFRNIVRNLDFGAIILHSHAFQILDFIFFGFFLLDFGAYNRFSRLLFLRFILILKFSNRYANDRTRPQPFFYFWIQVFNFFNRNLIHLRNSLYCFSWFYVMHVILFTADFGNLRRALHFHLCLEFEAPHKQSKHEECKQKQSFIHGNTLLIINYSHSMVAGGFDEMS